MRTPCSRPALVAAVIGTGSAIAQTRLAWVTFSSQPTSLGPHVDVLSGVNTGAELDAGAIDKDGWLNVVAVRKQPGG